VTLAQARTRMNDGAAAPRRRPAVWRPTISDLSLRPELVHGMDAVVRAGRCLDLRAAIACVNISNLLLAQGCDRGPRWRCASRRRRQRRLVQTLTYSLSLALSAAVSVTPPSG
jgi:hypothetical protein